MQPIVKKVRPSIRRDLVKLRERTMEYFSVVEKKGTKFTAYRCPDCGNLIPKICPTWDQVSSKGVWDSAMQCLCCGKVSFVVISPSGATKAVSFTTESETNYVNKPMTFVSVMKAILKV